MLIIYILTHCSTSAVHIDIGVVNRVVFKLSLQASSHTKYYNIQNNNILICTVNTGRLSISNNFSDILLYHATTTFLMERIKQYSSITYKVATNVFCKNYTH